MNYAPDNALRFLRKSRIYFIVRRLVAGKQRHNLTTWRFRTAPTSRSRYNRHRMPRIRNVGRTFLSVSTSTVSGGCQAAAMRARPGPSKNTQTPLLHPPYARRTDHPVRPATPFEAPIANELERKRAMPTACRGHAALANVNIATPSSGHGIQPCMRNVGRTFLSVLKHCFTASP